MSIAPECRLRVENSRSGALSLVAMYGELDMAVAAELTEAVTCALEDRPLIVAIDLRGLTFIDSSGIHALIDAGYACQTDGCRFYLIQGTRPINRLLSLCGLPDYFEIVSDLDHLVDGPPFLSDPA